MRKRIFIVFSLLAILLSACGSASSGGMEVTNAMVVLPGGDSMSGMDMSTNLAGYFQIKNNSSEDDRLLKVTCDFADAMMHETKMEGDVATMTEMYYVDVPAGATVEFKTGGMHVMLMNVSRELKIGDTVNLILQFEKAGSITVTAKVTGN